MFFAIDTSNFGDYSKPRLLAELAEWDGFFLRDHIGADWSFPIGDPWIALSAMAMTTERIKLGSLVTPLPRRRPWKLACKPTTLDHLAQGRLILGVGIGSDIEHEDSCFAKSTQDKQHGAMLDEGLEVLTGLWSGEPCHFEGNSYRVHEARFQPTPGQSPRIPIWVADVWPHRSRCAVLLASMESCLRKKTMYSRQRNWRKESPLFGNIAPTRPRSISSLAPLNSENSWSESYYQPMQQQASPGGWSASVVATHSQRYASEYAGTAIAPAIARRMYSFRTSNGKKMMALRYAALALRCCSENNGLWW